MSSGLLFVWRIVRRRNVKGSVIDFRRDVASPTGGLDLIIAHILASYIE